VHQVIPVLADEFVWHATNNDCPGKGKGSDDNTDGPLDAVDGDNGEGLSANEDNKDLTADHDCVDDDEKVVLVYVLEYVKFIV